VWAFWDGNLLNCLRYFPTQAFNLFFKDSIKKMFPKFDPKTEFAKFFAANFISGGLAAMGSLVIVYPLDHALLTRLAIVHPRKRDQEKRVKGGLVDFVKEKVSSGGVGALYTGFTISVLDIFMCRAFQLGLFHTITSLNPWRADKGFLGQVSKFLAAQTAITFGAGVSYPFDTVRRRLQMESQKPVEEQIYAGTLDCFKKIAVEEGPAGFYKGFYANCMRSIGGGIALMSYGWAKRSLGI